MSRLPLYVQIAKRLVEYLDEHPDQCSGNKLPPEERLAQLLNAGRNTVREALMYLEREGIVTKRQGSGNYLHRSVLATRAYVDTSISFADLIRRKGFEPSATPLSPKERRPDAIMARKLDLPEDTVFEVLERMYLADGHPAAYCVNFVPSEIIVNPNSAAYFGPIFAFLKDCCAQDLSHTIEEISTECATGAVASALRIPEGQPVLVWEEIHYNILDRPVATTVAYLNTDYIKLVLLHKLP